MAVTIRKVEPRDEPRWRELFDGYTRFYEREPSEAITRRTWTHLMDAASPVRAIVAVNGSGLVIGIANCIIHENTSALAASTTSTRPTAASYVTSSRIQRLDSQSRGRYRSPLYRCSLKGSP